MNTNIIEINSDNFEETVIKSDMPVAVYFYSDDCSSCAVLTPVFLRMAEVYKDKMKFVKIFRQHNRQLAEKYNIKSSPTIMFIKGGAEVCRRLSGYITKPELREAIDGVLGGYCETIERQNTHCDVLILGAGPAGLSAAIYAARAKLITAVVDEGLPGGQTASTYHVANYPGTNGVIRGIDLVENMKKQALDFGAFIDDMKEIHEINLSGEEKHIRTEDTDYYAKSVIIATGAQPRKLPAEGEKEFRGRGVHYCATCDGALYQDADIMVVGGGNSAVDEAIFLTRFAKKVTLVNIHESLNASKAAQDELFKNSAINVLWNHNIIQINGETFVKSVTAEDLKTGEQKEIATDGIFVYIGMEPKTAPFKDVLKLNEQGYIIADEDMKTNIPGVFAAGDVRNKRIRQISTAVGDGTIAGIMAEKFVNGK